jgi:ElaB/YqjD/DUF883 family membrane-anchored ribosome-binding protein
MHALSSATPKRRPERLSTGIHANGAGPMATMVRDKLLEQAAESIDALAEKAKDALYNASGTADNARRSINGARDTAWRFAGRAREQAGDVAGRVYQRGQETAQQLGRSLEKQPIMALVIVGIAGLLVGYTLRGR